MSVNPKVAKWLRPCGSKIFGSPLDDPNVGKLRRPCSAIHVQRARKWPNGLDLAADYVFGPPSDDPKMRKLQGPCCKIPRIAPDRPGSPKAIRGKTADRHHVLADRHSWTSYLNIVLILRIGTLRITPPWAPSPAATPTPPLEQAMV